MNGNRHFCGMTPAKQLPDRIDIIQSLRGIASVGVMITHLWHQQEKIIIELKLKQLAIAGAYGVQIFFIISGFILLYSLYKHDYRLNSYFRFIGRRLLRLEPAYIFSILLVLFFDLVVARWTGVALSKTSYSPLELLLHLLYLVPFYRGANWVQGVNWTLAIEFQFYVLVGLLAPLMISTRINKYIKHLVLAGLLALSTTYGELSFFIAWLSFFCVGMACFLWVSKNFNAADMALQILLAGAANYFAFKSPYFVAILAVVPVLIYTLLNRRIYLFLFLGKISYSLYLVHGVVGLFIAYYLQQKLNLDTVLMQMVALAVSMASSIGFAYVFYLLFELPFTRWSKKVRI